jgi:hypothetical protein
MVVVIGGPNGAGKTTISQEVLAHTIGIQEFVNADVIARGLSGFNPERAAIAAGRVMLTRLRELAGQRGNFAFESTLASRTFAPWLKSLKADGYEVHIIYVSLLSPDLAIRRVRARVRKGGHGVPSDIVIRRYYRSLHNLHHLYLPISDVWRVIDNSKTPILIAQQLSTGAPTVLDANRWNTLWKQADEIQDHIHEPE